MVNFLCDVQAIFLIIPVTGTQKLSQHDIHLITHEAGLGKANLDKLFGKLEISPEVQENGRCNANTEDFMLQSSSILHAWVQTEGSEATRIRVITALRGCRLKNAMEFLENKWDLTLE